MGRASRRVAGTLFASALLTLAGTSAALAQTETTSPGPSTDTPTSTTSTTTTTTTSDPSTPSAPGTTDAPSSPSNPVHTTEAAPRPDAKADPKAEPKLEQPARTSPGQDPYQDNVGHGFVGAGGEGVLVIACAAGAPGDLATKDLSVTGGPDQDGADGRLWNYSVRLVGDYPEPGVTEPFSWTCAGKPGSGVAEFQQPTPPPTTTTSETPTSSSSVPATSSTKPAGNSAPKAEVKVSPAGGVETGGGGTAF